MLLYFKKCPNCIVWKFIEDVSIQFVGTKLVSICCQDQTIIGKNFFQIQQCLAYQSLYLNKYPPFNHRLIITEPHSKKIFVDVHTSHRANIFSAKFLPASNIRKIVSCAGDGNILFTGNITQYLYLHSVWTDFTEGSTQAMGASQKISQIGLNFRSIQLCKECGVLPITGKSLSEALILAQTNPQYELNYKFST